MDEHSASTPPDLVGPTLAEEGHQHVSEAEWLAGKPHRVGLEIDEDVAQAADLRRRLLEKSETSVDDLEVKFREIDRRVVDVPRPKRIHRCTSQRERLVDRHGLDPEFLAAL